MTIQEVDNTFPLDEKGQLSDLDIGFLAIENYVRIVRNHIPTVGQIRASMPPIDDFLDPIVAAQEGAVHGREHIAAGFIIGISFLEKHARSVPMLNLPIQEILFAWRIHDLDVSNRKNYYGHGLHVVQRFEQSGKHLVYEPNQWELIRFLVIHHSERIDDIQANETLSQTPLRLREALKALQDMDASFLTRKGADVPIKEIRFRTMTAQTLKLQYIARVLLEEARRQRTGDPCENYIQAALKLQLLRPNDEQ